MPKLKDWQLQTDGKASAACALCPPFPFCFVDLFIFGFHTKESLLSLEARRDLDIIRRRQWMRGTAWDRTPQACCRRPDWAGCQEWLRGPSGTSLRHLTSALQLSPALTLSRLEAHMELRGRASGTWSITLMSYCKNISDTNVLEWLFHYRVQRDFWSEGCHLS